MMTGIVDVGGGIRGIYAAGIMDYCMDNDISFDLGIGVSAGSANLASFAARQRGRNYQFYTEYALRRRYMGVGNFLLHRSFVNLDYAYGTLSKTGGENPLDYDALVRNPMDLRVVATEAATGYPVYFTKSDIHRDDYQVMKASSAIPFICKPYAVDGVPYFDGALGDPVPVGKAFDLGCDKVVLILTKPADIPRQPNHDPRLADLIQKKYPKAAERLRRRAETYNAGVAMARDFAALGKLLILSPDDTCGVDTLTRDPAAMKRLYEKGYSDASQISRFLA